MLNTEFTTYIKDKWRKFTVNCRRNVECRNETVSQLKKYACVKDHYRYMVCNSDVLLNGRWILITPIHQTNTDYIAARLSIVRQRSPFCRIFQRCQVWKSYEYTSNSSNNCREWLWTHIVLIIDQSVLWGNGILKNVAHWRGLIFSLSVFRLSS